MSRNPFRIACNWYMMLLDTKPLLAQSISTSLLMASGDAISQLLIERKSTIDPDRNKNFLLVGAFFLGPLLSKWNRFIDLFFVGSRSVKTFKMLAADQLAFTPPLVFGIVSSLGILSGLSLDQLRAKLIFTYPGILKTNYLVWPAIQIVNFAFVPLRFRVLYINTFALFWNIYLAYAMQKIPVPRTGLSLTVTE